MRPALFTLLPLALVGFAFSPLCPLLTRNDNGDEHFLWMRRRWIRRRTFRNDTRWERA